MNGTPSLRINALANAAGRLSSMVLAILCTPLYIHFLGIEAYGLIGFYISLQAAVSILEMGLGRACNRELARYSAQGVEGHQAMPDTLRSLEVIYFLTAIALGVGLTASSSWISASWLHSKSYTHQYLMHVIMIIGWVIAIRWPSGIYIGALMGMQRQVILNVTQVFLSVLNWGGSVLLLWMVRPDIRLFFQWQILIALVSTIAYGALAWKSLSIERGFFHGKFSTREIKRIIPFSAGVASNSILGLILTQADKLILSAILPLKQFGYYALASVVSNALSMLATPISNAVFPRLSALTVDHEKEKEMASMYHLASQASVTVVASVAMVIAFFSSKVLYVYTGNLDIVKSAATVLMVLAISKMIHGFMIVPYSLQLAYGWLKLSLYINIVSAIWLLPAIFWLTSLYGPVGAAMAWLMVTIAYMFIGIPLMHRKLLVGQGGRWFLHAIVLPISTLCAYMALVRIAIDGSISSYGRWYQGGILLMVGIMGFIIAILSARDLRMWIYKELVRRY